MSAVLNPEAPPEALNETPWRTRRPIGGRLAGGAAVAALVAVIWWASTQQATVTRKTAEDSVLVPVVPPPPPPPPPPEPKPVEKPEDVPPPPLNQPQPTPQQPTPQQPTPAAPSAGQAVSIDGPAQAGGDAFNIGAGSGGGMRGGGAIGSGLGGFNRAAYAAYLENEFRRAVSAEPALRTAVLRAKARVWIDKAGRITRVDASGSEHSTDIEQALTGRTVRAPDASLAMPVAVTLEFRRNG